MKSWKNRRNTYWILIATAFGLMFPSNHTTYYKNFIGLVLCWGLYWVCFICNNREVEKQEQKEKEEHQKRVELELAKKEKERIEKEKEIQWFNEKIEYPKTITFLMDKYNRDWEKDLYPSDARYYINDIKKKIKTEIEYEEREIHIYEDYIKKLESIKKKIRSPSNQKELNNKINTSQYMINRCKEHINNIPQKYNSQIDFYQNKIEKYKEQCREHEQKANELFLYSPEKIIKAVDYYLNKIEKIKKESIKNNYNNNINIWIHCEEEKIPYLLQARLDAINKIKGKN